MGYQSSQRYKNNDAGYTPSAHGMLECIKAFVDFMNRQQEERDNEAGYTLTSPQFSFLKTGIKYAAVRHGGSAYAFVELSTGLIWKPKDFRGPIKNFPRGSVLDPTSYRDFSIYGI